MHLLITRPLIQANRTARKLQNFGCKCTVEPLLQMEAIDTQIPKGIFDTIIITSANALPALDKYWSSQNRAEIPVITTGEVTKSEIEKLGFMNCKSVNGSVVDLVDKFFSLVPNAQNILYPCAEEVSMNLVQILGSLSHTCVSWVVYKMNSVHKLSPIASERLTSGEIDGIVLYSSKTARVFSDIWKKEYSKQPVPLIFALSEKISDVLPLDISQHCSFPANPNENDLFKLILKSTINTDK